MAGRNQADIHAVNWELLPKPEDDGAASHLMGMTFPSIDMNATDGTVVNLSAFSDLTIVFIYPMTANPDIPLPENWDMIPGARGCTPQACAFRELESDLQFAGADRLFGLSVQSSDYQREAAERLHLPYPLLSDENLALKDALNLPAMNVEGTLLLRRLILAIRDEKIEQVWYPVFPPDQSAQMVLDWLKNEAKA